MTLVTGMNGPGVDRTIVMSTFGRFRRLRGQPPEVPAIRFRLGFCAIIFPHGSVFSNRLDKRGGLMTVHQWRAIPQFRHTKFIKSVRLPLVDAPHLTYLPAASILSLRVADPSEVAGIASVAESHGNSVWGVDKTRHPHSFLPTSDCEGQGE
jgi:hypothetical protein